MFKEEKGMLRLTRSIGLTSGAPPRDVRLSFALRGAVLAIVLAVASCDRSGTSFEESLAGPSEPGVRDVQPSALGSNGLIVYTCLTEGGLSTDICTLDPVSGAVVNLTNDAEFDAFPDWSPDASRIVFDSFRSTNQPTIHVMNSDGTGITRISSTPCCDRDFQATWSPDGSRIAFVSTRDGDGEYELYVMDVVGEFVGPPATRLTNDPAPEFGQGVNDWQPAWSPDSRRLAFVSNRDPEVVDACDIYVMDAADADGDGFGDNMTRLTFDNDFECELIRPAWSPTGEQIAFTSTRSNDHEVWVMDADGSNLVNVTDFPGQDFDAGWSPDGTQITFVSGRDGDYEIYSTPAPPPSSGALVAAASAPVTQLTNNTTDDLEPDWGVGATVVLPCTASDLSNAIAALGPDGDGTLNRGQTNAMLVKVSQALKFIDKGKIDKAEEALENLLDGIARLRSRGVLTVEQADDLSRCAGEVIAAL
jgi:Tol biopolymer transport system component